MDGLQVVLLRGNSWSRRPVCGNHWAGPGTHLHTWGVSLVELIHTWRSFIIRGHIKLLAKRNAALKLLGLEVRKCALGNLVEKGLEDLEWTWEDGKWAHAYLPNGFAEEDVLDDKKWNKISHAIRESYRCVAFNRLCVSDRHDAREIREIPYSEKRRKLAVSWAVKDASFTSIYAYPWWDTVPPPTSLLWIS